MCVRPLKLREQKVNQMHVPCGQCIECRLKRSREWAVRCVHEASLHEDNSFVTLTYSDSFLPVGGSLDRRAFPLFMKRLRKAKGPIRYFHAGEYGEKDGRPHYHALLFGLRVADRTFVGKSESGFPQFASDELSALWGAGFVTLGDISFESASYVARYVVEKCKKTFLGMDVSPEYGRVNFWTGEFVKMVPEYATMSRGRRPDGGIGFRWQEKFREELAVNDSVRVRGHEMVPPRFYDKQLEAAELEVVKARRIRKYGERCTIANGVTWRTNAAREAIAVANLKRLEAQRG